MLSNHDTVWLMGGLCVVVLNFKFYQNQMSSYQDVRGQNLPYSITLANGLHNSLYYHTGLIERRILKI